MASFQFLNFISCIIIIFNFIPILEMKKFRVRVDK